MHGFVQILLDLEATIQLLHSFLVVQDLEVSHLALLHPLQVQTRTLTHTHTPLLPPHSLKTLVGWFSAHFSSSSSSFFLLKHKRLQLGT